MPRGTQQGCGGAEVQAQAVGLQRLDEDPRPWPQRSFLLWAGRTQNQAGLVKGAEAQAARRKDWEVLRR